MSAAAPASPAKPGAIEFFRKQLGFPLVPAGMLIGGYPLLMLYNTLSNSIVYGTDELEVKDFPKAGFILCGAAVILYSLCAATYWKWLGRF